jgi:hypothetical protein
MHSRSGRQERQCRARSAASHVPFLYPAPLRTALSSNDHAAPAPTHANCCCRHGGAGLGGAGRGLRRATYLLVFNMASVQLFKVTLSLHLRTRGDRFVSLLNICVYEVCVCAYMHICVDADMRICVDADTHMTAQPRTYTRTLTCPLTRTSRFTRAARARLARPRHTFICARICIPISIYRRALAHTAGTDGCTSSRRACKRAMRSLAARDTRSSCG